MVIRGWRVSSQFTSFPCEPLIISDREEWLATNMLCRGLRNKKSHPEIQLSHMWAHLPCLANWNYNRFAVLELHWEVRQGADFCTTGKTYTHPQKLLRIYSLNASTSRSYTWTAYMRCSGSSKEQFPLLVWCWMQLSQRRSKHENFSFLCPHAHPSALFSERNELTVWEAPSDRGQNISS